MVWLWFLLTLMVDTLIARCLVNNKQKLVHINVNRWMNFMYQFVIDIYEKKMSQRI